MSDDSRHVVDISWRVTNKRAQATNGNAVLPGLGTSIHPQCPQPISAAKSETPLTNVFSFLLRCLSLQKPSRSFRKNPPLLGLSYSSSGSNQRIIIVHAEIQWEGHDRRSGRCCYLFLCGQNETTVCLATMYSSLCLN